MRGLSRCLRFLAAFGWCRNNTGEPQAPNFEGMTPVKCVLQSYLIRCLNIGTGSFRLLLFGFLLVTSSGLYLLIDVGAQADEGNIKVVEVGAENRYPQGIRFFVTASSPDRINEIRLFFKKTGRVTASAYRALEFDPGDLVNADSLLSTSGGQNYMPPGTEIT